MPVLTVSQVVFAALRPPAVCLSASTDARHVRIHTQERPFACPMPGCPKRFIQKSALKVHINVHTGARPYKCQVCSKAFADTSSLARHRRTHTGRRPYKCQVVGCGKEFCRRVTLTRHVQRNHPEEDHPMTPTSVLTFPSAPSVTMVPSAPLAAATHPPPWPLAHLSAPVSAPASLHVKQEVEESALPLEHVGEPVSDAPKLGADSSEVKQEADESLMIWQSPWLPLMQSTPTTAQASMPTTLVQPMMPYAPPAPVPRVPLMPPPLMPQALQMAPTPHFPAIPTQHHTALAPPVRPLSPLPHSFQTSPMSGSHAPAVPSLSGAMPPPVGAHGAMSPSETHKHSLHAFPHTPMQARVSSFASSHDTPALSSPQSWTSPPHPPATPLSAPLYTNQAPYARWSFKFE